MVSWFGRSKPNKLHDSAAEMESSHPKTELHPPDAEPDQLGAVLPLPKSKSAAGLGDGCWREPFQVAKSAEGGLLDRLKAGYEVFRASSMKEHYVCVKVASKEMAQKFMPKSGGADHGNVSAAGGDQGDSAAAAAGHKKEKDDH